ncbi:MAG: hypothetical protein AAF628_29705 [Planctomycetota bacterium]
MNQRHRSLPFVAALVGLAAVTPTQPPPIDFSALDRACGLQADPSGWLGMGPNYEARFDGRGFTFVPALGASAPRAASLRFELLGVGRGGSDRVSSDLPVTVVDGVAVHYDRPEVRETYEVRPDGVEQSFTFATLPPGQGDLVVRGRFSTGLPLDQVSDRDLRFGDAVGGGIFVTDVVGIGADGTRAPGTLHYLDGVLELRLPAAFVDTAALPLVLDPLIGTSREPSPGWDDRDPDVAYHGPSDRYLVVWERRFSSSSTAVRGHVLDGAGNPVGSTLGIRSTNDPTNPRVAALSGSDRFAVVWEEDGDIMGAPVRTSGAVQTAFRVAAGTLGNVVQPDVAAVKSGSRAVVVWSELSSGKIRAQSTNFPPSMIGVLSEDVSQAPQGDEYPSIAAQAGDAGHLLVTWSRDSGSIDQVFARVIGTLGRPETNEFRVSTGDDATDPAVDGNGNQWVVAYESMQSGDVDIRVRAVAYDAAASAAYFQTPPTIIAGDPTRDEVSPSVGWMGNSVLIGYSESAGPLLFNGHVTSLDPFTCFACESTGTLQGIGGRSEVAVHIAGQWPTGPSGNGDGALVAWWSYDTFTNDGNVLAEAYAAEDGDEVDVGGGCGSGGVARASCARRGNGQFRPRLFGAAPGRTAYPILSARQRGLACGACTLVPDLRTGFVLGSPTTNAQGDTSLQVPLPNDPALASLSLYLQWLVQSPTGSCIGFDMSNGVRFTIH